MQTDLYLSTETVTRSIVHTHTDKVVNKLVSHASTVYLFVSVCTASLASVDACMCLWY